METAQSREYFGSRDGGRGGHAKLKDVSGHDPEKCEAVFRKIMPSKTAKAR
jgi:hypothetical protein